MRSARTLWLGDRHLGGAPRIWRAWRGLGGTFLFVALGGLAPLGACHPTTGTDATAECGSLSKFNQAQVGCINLANASLGEVYAITLDGSRAPFAIGAFARTTPASASDLSSAPASCVDILSAPITTAPAGVDFQHTFQLPAFTTELSGSYDGYTVELNADIAQNEFDLNVGQLVTSTLNDPTRLLACTSEAVQAVSDYWGALTTAAQANTAFFLVTQIVSTDSLSVTTSTGTSVSVDFQSYEVASVKFSVSYSCDELIGLPGDAGFAPVFFSGGGVSFDPTASTFAFSQVPLTCNSVE